MKISQKKTFEEHNDYCIDLIPGKIPNWRTTDWRLRMGDCIYDYSKGNYPIIRKSVHNETNRERDLSGKFVVLSDTFYYFGEKAETIPVNLEQIVKRNQGHKLIQKEYLIKEFEHWIIQFKRNILHADPQLRWKFDKDVLDSELGNCAKKDLNDDEDESEEVVC